MVSKINTDRLFDRDSYIVDFSATVIKSSEVEWKEKKLYATVLDLTAFFPEGGGQASDTGYIDDKRVIDVQNVDGEIVHYLDAFIEEGRQVVGKVDFDKRYLRMQNHSAEHLLCGLIHNAYGYDNVGFHLNDEEVTFDVDGPLTGQQILEIEEAANDIIYENVPITISLPSANELLSLNYRSKLELSENVRIVTIEGYDSCACCAPHVRSTGEIGIIKIIDSFPHRGGIRLTMIAGRLAYKDYSLLDASNRTIMNIVSSKRTETAEFTNRLNDKCKILQEENTKLKKQITEYSIEKIKNDIRERDEKDTRPFLIFSDTLDLVQLRETINSSVVCLNSLVAGFVGNDSEGYKYIIATGESVKRNDLKELAKKLSEKFGGRGGGSDKMIQGAFVATRKRIEEYFVYEVEN